MQRGQYLQLPCSPPDALVVTPCIRAVGAKVAVQMVPSPERIGRIFLPSKVGGDSRPDVGVVIAAPSWAQVRKGVEIPFPKPGTTVCVWPEDGIWIESAETGCGSLSAHTRVYGVFAEFVGEPMCSDWWDSIVCEMRNEKLIPFGDKIVLRLDPLEEREGRVLIPQFVQTRTGMATVESAGPLALDVQPGDRVCYSPSLLLDHGLRVERAGLLENRAICDERAILYAISP